MKAVFLLIALAFCAHATSVYDDFSGGIVGWEERCLPATWYASGGFAWCSTESMTSALVFPGQIATQDGAISTYGSGNHTFGVIARLDSLDTGICAYLSPDYNLARIRRVSEGVISYTLATLNYDFPIGDYAVTFTCNGSNLTFTIEHIQSSQTWVLNAYSDDDVQVGEWGLLAGQTTAWWDWVELQYDNTATEGEVSSPLPQPALLPQQNPFIGSVLIAVENVSPGASLSVFDLSGREVESLDVSSGTAMFTPEHPGVYLARLNGEAEAQVVKLVCLP